jgi:hypothetical protein
MENDEHDHCSAVTSATLLLSHFSWITAQLTEQDSSIDEEQSTFAKILKNLEDIRTL